MDRIRISRRVLLGGLTAIGLAAAGMGSVPAANATCVSIFGIGNSTDCYSTATSVAIAIGDGAVANAYGFLGAAYSIGNGAQAFAGPIDLAFAAGPSTVAAAVGRLSAAIATGAQGGPKRAEAFAGYDENGVDPQSTDFANIAVTLASDSYVVTGGINKGQVGAGNVALNLGQGNDVEADGFLNSALAVGGSKPFYDNIVHATGTLNNATHIGGNGNSVHGGTSASSVLNLAFNFFGSNNLVTAGPGPFALAGALFTNATHVEKAKPGFNINGLKVPNTAATVSSASTVKPTAAVKPSADSRAKS